MHPNPDQTTHLICAKPFSVYSMCVNSLRALSHCSHFTDEKTGSEKVGNLSQSHSSEVADLNLGLAAAEPGQSDSLLSQTEKPAHSQE